MSPIGTIFDQKAKANWSSLGLLKSVTMILGTVTNDLENPNVIIAIIKSSSASEEGTIKIIAKIVPEIIP